MDVVIAGGGIGGLALAALLSRTGSHAVTVLERAPAYGAAGYGIGLYPLGGAVFNAMGLADELKARSSELTTYRVHGPDGKVLQEVDLKGLLADFGPMVGVSRADLVDMMASKVPEGAIRFGATVVGAQSLGDRVRLDIDGGDSVEGDVAVAADGMYSRLRGSLFGDVKPTDTGFDAWMWWAPESTGPSGVASEHWAASSFVGLYPMPGRVNVAVGVPRELSPSKDAGSDEILGALRAIVTEHNPAAAGIEGLFDITEGKPFLWRLEDVRAPDIVALDNRLALLGDSGIGFLPTAGVGASNALRSAAALAYDLSLADAATAPVAVQRWRERVRKLVQGNQTASRRLAEVMMVKHDSSSKVVNLLMKHLPVTTMTKSIVESMRAPL